MLGPTGPNRLYLYAGTSSGHIANGPGVAAGQPSIFKRLTTAGVSFGVYSNASSSGPGCPGPYSFETSIFCADIPQGAKTFAQFQADAKAGTLPHVVWIYPGSDEHPPSDIQNGESDVQKFYDALAASPQWSHAAFVITYDEGGGQYDHVPPPPACLPDAIPPNIPAEGSTPGKFDRYGFRVPMIIASAYSKLTDTSATSPASCSRGRCRPVPWRPSSWRRTPPRGESPRWGSRGRRTSSRSGGPPG